MASTEAIPIFDTVAQQLDNGSHIAAIGRLGLITLSFAVSPLHRYYRTIRAQYKDEPATMQLPLGETVTAIKARLDQTGVREYATLTPIQLTNFVGTMYQFSDRTPFLHSAMRTPYETISQLYDQVVETACAEGPVGLERQLDMALNQADDHIPSALWNLFITNRHFSRWRDGEVIDRLPEYTSAEILDRMHLWQQSLTACKSADEHSYQDAAGDAYYVWTHAMARMIYNGLAAQPTCLSEFYTTAFEYGSHIMSLSRKLGVVSVFGTMSDHVPASRYGNAIGQACADAVRHP